MNASRFVRFVLALVLVTTSVGVHAWNVHMVDPSDVDSSDPSAYGWVYYQYTQQGVAISVSAFAYEGDRPIEGYVRLNRAAVGDDIFRGGFEDGEQGSSSAVVNVVLSHLDWDSIAGGGYRMERGVTTLTASGRYQGTVAYTDDDEYTNLEFDFVIPSFDMVPEICATPQGGVLRYRIRSLGALSQTASLLRAGSIQATGLPITPFALGGGGTITVPVSYDTYRNEFANEVITTTLVISGETVRVPLLYPDGRFIAACR